MGNRSDHTENVSARLVQIERAHARLRWHYAALGIASLGLVSTWAHGTPSAPPQSFQAGTSIVAAEVNALFEELYSGVNALELDSAPVGTVLLYAGASAPDGWLACDGTAFDAADYPDLADALQERWGQFNCADGSMGEQCLPDLRGRFPRGLSSADTDRFALYGGVAGGVGSYQAHEVGPHSHDASTDISPNPHTHQTRVPGGGGSSGQAGNTQGLVYEGSTGTSLTATTTVESSPGAESRPDNAMVLYIIRAK